MRDEAADVAHHASGARQGDTWGSRRASRQGVAVVSALLDDLGAGEERLHFCLSRAPWLIEVIDRSGLVAA
jgi:hypothetical protein